MKDSNPIQYGMNWLKTDGVLVKLLFDKFIDYQKKNIFIRMIKQELSFQFNLNCTCP